MPTTRFRTTWLVIGSVLAVVTFVWGSSQSVGLLAHRRHRTYTVISAPVTTVEVSSDNGSLHILGTTDTTVTIDATVSEGLFSPTRRDRVAGGRLTISATCPPILNTFCGVDYTIRVPSNLSVKVRASGGSISVSGIDGELDLSSSGGGVTVTGGRGSMRLGSSGGTIRASGIAGAAVSASSSGGGVHLSFAQPPTSVSASSSGGGVTVDLPDTPDTYQVRASSSGGSTHTNVRTDPASTRIINAHSSGGGVEVRYTIP